MKNIYLTAVLTLIATFALAQDSEMIVEPGPVGTLNEAILSDTTATGERADENRVYVLRRGVPYVLSGTLEYADYHLRIKAEDGDGTRPLLISDTGDDGLSQYFRTRGDSISNPRRDSPFRRRYFRSIC